MPRFYSGAFFVSRKTRTFLYIGLSRRPASRDTRTSLYIGHSRRPASRDTRTSLYIEV